MAQTPPTRRPHRNEEGYVLVAVVFMMVILILSLSIAIPKVRASIQRDREQETMERGKQYIRAIQLYYRKFNAYPPNIDALVKTNDIRFLRKRYIDPMTGKDDWKPILWGQNKTPIAMGFFGQPLAAGFGGGIGPSGGNTPGGIGAGGGPFGGPAASGGIGTQTGGGLFNSNPTSSTDSGTSSSTPQTGAGGTDNSGTGTPTGTATGTGSSSSTSTSSTGTTSSSNNPTGSGQAFGGGGIIGFSPASPKQSILVYKKKNHYNEWEFLYSPLIDQQQMAGGNTGAIGQPAGSTTTPIGGGTNPTTPTSPTTPTTPTAPQQ